jgi:hypothetical protein
MKIAYSRELYSVGGTRVVLDDRGHWRCESRTCQPGKPCTHVGQAQRFRDMRGTKPPDETVGLEFLETEPRADSDTPPVARVPAPERRRTLWVHVLAAVGVAGLSSGLTYVATTRTEPVSAVTAEPVPVVAAAPTPQMPRPEPLPPVQVVNAFDPEEVFEFPPGTSESEARKAAADLLLQRARQRLAF